MKIPTLSQLSFFVLFTSLSFASTFESALRVPTGNQPDAVAVGDFNGDGIPDVAVANSDFEAPSVQIFLGKGNGTFKPLSPIALDAPPTAIAAGDFNNDHILDVAVLTKEVFVLLGKGDGTFRIGGPHGSSGGTSLIAADFNGDKNLDLAFVNGRSVDVMFGNGTGGFGTAHTYPAGTGPAWIATGDFNGDGAVDLVASGANPNTGQPVVDVLLNKGNGTFGGAIQTKIAHGGWNVVVGDFNGDGKQDIAVGNASTNAGSNIAVLFGKGNGRFSSPTYYSTGQGPVYVVAADLNGDQKTDLVAGNSGDNDLSLLISNGKGQFTVGPNFAVGAGNLFVVASDFNRDGRMDLLTANSYSNDLSLVLNQGGGNFQSARDFRAQWYTSYVALADFNNDGNLDMGGCS